MVDDEFGDIAHKEKSFADTVMFWRNGSSSAAPRAPGAATPAPVDAAIVGIVDPSSAGD